MPPWSSGLSTWLRLPGPGLESLPRQSACSSPSCPPSLSGWLIYGYLGKVNCVNPRLHIDPCPTVMSSYPPQAQRADGLETITTVLHSYSTCTQLCLYILSKNITLCSLDLAWLLVLHDREWEQHKSEGSVCVEKRGQEN